jgi:hypothetical protein
MIPRDGKYGVLSHRDSLDKQNMLGRREQVVGGLDESKSIDIVLSPGEMSLHDPLVVHGSGPSRSATRRVGFAIRYVPASVRQANGRLNSATHVRGRDYGHFEPEFAPEGLFHAEAVRRHRQVLRLGMGVIFGDAGAAHASPGDK